MLLRFSIYIRSINSNNIFQLVFLDEILSRNKDLTVGMGVGAERLRSRWIGVQRVGSQKVEAATARGGKLEGGGWRRDMARGRW